jgi:DNA polymerase-3 subunit alpha
MPTIATSLRACCCVQDRIGYLNLCALLSRAWLGNQHRGRAEFEPAWFEEPGEEGLPLATGLIALSGAMGGDVGQALANNARWRAPRRSTGRACSRSFYIDGCSAQARRTDGYVRRRCNWPPRCSCRWSPRIRCSS